MSVTYYIREEAPAAFSIVRRDHSTQQCWRYREVFENHDLAFKCAVEMAGRRFWPVNDFEAVPGPDELKPSIIVRIWRDFVALLLSIPPFVFLFFGFLSISLQLQEVLNRLPH